jgi:hypothetical protein
MDLVLHLALTEQQLQLLTIQLRIYQYIRGQVLGLEQNILTPQLCQRALDMPLHLALMALPLR